MKLDIEAIAACVAGLRAAAQRVERPPELGKLEISVTPSVPLDADTVRRFQDAGVERLVPLALAGNAEDLIASLEQMAGALSGMISPPP
jgi:hypothetical protein